MLSSLSPDAAAALLDGKDILWHQRFELTPGIFTPGTNDVEQLLELAGVPSDLSGASVLDIGTTNGGTAFALERRGAERVLATDIYDGDRFGFNAIRDALGSSAEFRKVSIYELAQHVEETFDIVIFWACSTTCATRCWRSTTSRPSRAGRPTSRRPSATTRPTPAASCRSRASTRATNSPVTAATGLRRTSPH
jgi:hypothetical protein